MRIFTSSWFAPLPDSIQKIGISRGTPRGYKAGYRKMVELAPGPWFKSVSPEVYHKLFMDHLRSLNAEQVAQKIATLGGGRDVALLCYEAPHDPKAWCHRAHVSAWLKDELGLDVPEWGMEDAGTGWLHPKFLPQFKREPAPPVDPLDVSPWRGRKAERGGVTWEVKGRSDEFPDQAEIMCKETGELRAISKETLITRFGEAA